MSRDRGKLIEHEQIKLDGKWTLHFKEHENGVDFYATRHDQGHYELDNIHLAAFHAILHLKGINGYETRDEGEEVGVSTNKEP